MKATIRIVNAHFYSYIGALPEEQVLGNRYIVNLTATYDATKAVASDDVADAVSYADLYDVIADKVGHSRDNLLEYVAGQILTEILDKYQLVDSCEITIQKAIPPIAGVIEAASVTLATSRDNDK
ncbi:dihydroneopterin aldolase [Porphyromonas vaginalis]|uniref:dihydroneopterin aldolase n=1 Tax=Porphyromonas vaginalis TaxID=3044325 RepID=UPI0026293F7E|nr:dihydroneopterin aldolase [Porphyromonas vaginalis]